MTLARDTAAEEVVLALYVRRPFFLRRFKSEPLGQYMDGFAHALHEAGYSTKTAEVYLCCAAHLGTWVKRTRRRVRTLDEAVIGRFCDHLPSCRCPPPIGSRSAGVAHGAARWFLRHLREEGAVDGKPATPPLVPILRRFEQWMRQHRGIREATLDIYRPILQDLLQAVGDDPTRYSARPLRQFVLRRASQRGSRQASSTVAAVRMFLRYVGADGLCPAGLDQAVPKIASWSLSSLPRGIPSEGIDRILAACDLGTPFGRRDRAIILLLVRLGLRSGDVLRLRLDDIDWDRASLRVEGKGRQETCLPLPQEVGDAILAYLEHDRPTTNDRRVFFKVLAPRAPLSGNNVSQIVSRAIRRAGVDAPSRGAHVLRQSAATEMLKQGASIDAIAGLLRHRYVETTVAHYAKVDMELLQLVVQPWPGE